MGTIGDIIWIIKTILNYFIKGAFTSAQNGKKDVDEEADKNKETGRPSGEFWDDRNI